MRYLFFIFIILVCKNVVAQISNDKFPCSIVEQSTLLQIKANPKAFLDSLKGEDCVFAAIESLVDLQTVGKGFDKIEALNCICDISDGIVSTHVGLVANRLFKKEPEILIAYFLKNKKTCLLVSLTDEVSSNIAVSPVSQHPKLIEQYATETETILFTKRHKHKLRRFFRRQMLPLINPSKFIY